MVRRYDEVIEVRETSTSGPALFLWRGRVYAVRSILGHWRERRAWWLEGATARLLGLEQAPVADSWEEPMSQAEAAVADVLEREIWRVEAGAGRSDTVGVYDLGRDIVDLDSDGVTALDDSPATRSHWRLLQITD
jgi:hypothetical protein